MSRIAARFAALWREDRGALIPVLEAHDPDLETSMAILRGLPGAGADLIEVGAPFTDPMADGPTIQRDQVRGLADTVRAVRRCPQRRETQRRCADRCWKGQP